MARAGKNCKIESYLSSLQRVHQSHDVLNFSTVKYEPIKTGLIRVISGSLVVTTLMMVYFIKEPFLPDTLYHRVKKPGNIEIQVRYRHYGTLPKGF